MEEVPQHLNTAVLASVLSPQIENTSQPVSIKKVVQSDLQQFPKADLTD